MKDELVAVLGQFNPSWRNEPIADLPKWRRAVLRLAGIDAVLDARREREPKAEGPEHLLLDETQFDQ